MVSRIVTGARPHTRADGDLNELQTRPATPVIADWGTTAELLVFPPGEPVARGVRFHYRGTIWVVTVQRRDSCILVAEPDSH